MFSENIIKLICCTFIKMPASQSHNTPQSICKGYLNDPLGLTLSTPGLVKWHISNETWKSGYKLIKIVRIDGKVPATAGQKKQALILREKTLIWKNAEKVLILPWIRSWPCAQRGQSASGIIAADERHGWWWFVFFLMFLFLHFYYLRVVHGSLYSILGVFLLTLLLCYFWLKPQECEN